MAQHNTTLHTPCDDRCNGNGSSRMHSWANVHASICIMWSPPTGVSTSMHAAVQCYRNKKMPSHVRKRVCATIAHIHSILCVRAAEVHPTKANGIIRQTAINHRSLGTRACACRARWHTHRSRIVRAHTRARARLRPKLCCVRACVWCVDSYQIFVVSSLIGTQPWLAWLAAVVVVVVMSCVMRVYA